MGTTKPPFITNFTLLASSDVKFIFISPGNDCPLETSRRGILSVRPMKKSRGKNFRLWGCESDRKAQKNEKNLQNVVRNAISSRDTPLPQYFWNTVVKVSKTALSAEIFAFLALFLWAFLSFLRFSTDSSQNIFSLFFTFCFLVRIAPSFGQRAIPFQMQSGRGLALYEANTIGYFVS